jgi:Domain of unknown function (DUF4412)
MKYLAVCLSLVVASAASAQGTFEGVVTYQMGAQQNQTFEYMAKGSKVRFSVNAPAGSGNGAGMMAGGGMILDASAQTMTMIIPAAKMYMTQPIPQQHLSDTAGRGGKITKVGSEVVAGIPCDDYRATDSQGHPKGMFCVAHGMGNFMSAMQSRGVMADLAARMSGMSAAISGGFFPLKFVKEDGTTAMIATKVEKKSVDDSYFTVPADYRQMPVPAGAPH